MPERTRMSRRCCSSVRPTCYTRMGQGEGLSFRKSCVSVHLLLPAATSGPNMSGLRGVKTARGKVGTNEACLKKEKHSRITRFCRWVRLDVLELDNSPGA